MLLHFPNTGFLPKTCNFTPSLPVRLGLADELRTVTINYSVFVMLFWTNALTHWIDYVVHLLCLYF